MERPCGKTAIVASILLHAAVAAALILRLDNATDAPHGDGMTGVAVSLAPGGGTAGWVAASPFDAVSDPAATPVSTVESREDAPLVDPDSIEAKAFDSAEPTAAEPAAVEPTAVEPTATKPLEVRDTPAETVTAAIETAVAIEPEPDEPTVSKAEEPRTATPVDVAEVPPQTVTATAPTKTATKKPKELAAAPADADAPDSPMATTSSEQGDQAPAASSDAGASSAGTVGVAAPDRSGTQGAADYMALLQAWLEKHKQYPRRAQIRHLQGTALLYFAMDADGRVLSFRVTRSSGHALLDAEVEAMIRRATPLPAVPASLRGARLEFVVPVQFVLR